MFKILKKIKQNKINYEYLGTDFNLNYLYSLLDKWVQCTLRLEKEYRYDVNIKYDKDYEFLLLIGKSVYLLNLINSILIFNLESFNKKIKDDKDKKRNKKLAQFWRFFNSLIASKIKHFFFRELPVSNTNIPDLDLDFEIAHSTYLLIKLLDKFFRGDKSVITKLEVVSCKSFFYQSLYYSFLYNDVKNEGCFLRFKYDGNTFKEIKSGLIEKKLKDFDVQRGNEETLRLFTSNYLCYLMSYYYNQKEELLKPACYKKLYKKIREKSDFYFEPFTYYLGDIIWKLDGMIQSDDEYLNAEKKNVYEQELIAKVKTFIKSFLDIAQKSYDNRNIHYGRFYEIEAAFIDDIYKLLLPEKSSKELDTYFDIFEKVSSSRQPLLFLCGRDSDRINNLNDIISKLAQRGEKTLKLEYILSILNIDEIISLLSAYSYLFLNEEIDGNRKDIAFVGFYKAGVFLAHIINLAFGTKHRVWLFKTKPYVAVHPIHEDKIYDEILNIFLFDESIKTAFTYSLYESYLKRNLYLSSFRIKLYPIFDFVRYKKVVENIEYFPLFRLNEKFIPINFQELEYLSKTIKKLKFNFKNNKNGIIKENLKVDTIIAKLLEENKRYKKDKLVKYDKYKFDFTCLLANTDLVFNICYSFAQKITKLESKKICMYAPSGEGEVLLLLTAFIVKLLDSNKELYLQPSYIDVKNIIKKNISFVAIDLSIISGFSLAYNWSILKEGMYNPSRKLSYLEDFDLILTICASSDLRLSNIYTFYYI